MTIPRQVGTATAVLVSMLVALAASLPSLGHDFVYDDVHVVAERELMQEGRLGELLTTTYWPQDKGGALWRPGALIFFRAQWALGGGDPALFHGFNVILYASVAALFALLVARLFGPVVGLAGGVLFAAHPVHVEVTANVVGQAELVPAICYLLVLLLVWTSVEATRGQRFLLASATALVVTVGLSFKEHMATLPGAVAVVWWLAAMRSGDGFRDVARREWPMLAGVVLPVVLYVGGRALVLGEVTHAGGVAPGLDPDSALQRLGVMLPVSLHWLRLLFWPVDLSADYGPAHLVPMPGFGWAHWIALTLWFLLAGTAWSFRRQVPSVAVGLGLFFVTISIVSNVVVPLEILLAERLLFLPSMGWAIASAGIVVHIGTRSARSRRLAAMVVGGAGLLLLARSLERVPTWSDNDRFFQQMAEDAPESFRIAMLEGERALAEGDTAHADQAFGQALRRNPYDALLAERMGLMRLQRGDPAGAVPLFIHALERRPERQPSLLGLSLSLARTGRVDDALRWLDWLEELHDTGLETTVARIEALEGGGRNQEALEVATRALEDHPGAWHLHLLAAQSAARAGLCGVSLEHIDLGRPLAPEPRHPEFDRLVESIRTGEAPCQESGA